MIYRLACRPPQPRAGGNTLARSTGFEYDYVVYQGGRHGSFDDTYQSISKSPTILD